MGTLDIILLVCFIPAIIRGLSKGFVEQAVALISIFAGTWVAYHFSQLLCAWMEPHFPTVSEKTMMTVAFIILLVVSIMALFVAGKLLTKVVRLVMLGWLDRLLGFIFAIMKAALLLGLVIVLFERINVNHFLVKEATLADSQVYCFIRSLAYTVFPYLKELITNATA